MSAVRREILEVRSRWGDHVVEPGGSWSSAERVAIVAEVDRAVRSELDLPPWVGPSTVDGLIPDDHPLPAHVVDVVWRIVCHPGTLTRSWFDDAVAAGLDPTAHVELVGLVSMAVAWSSFDRAVGREPAETPMATGAPAHDRHPDRAVGRHWVPTVDEEGVPNVRTALSAAPAAFEMQGLLLDAWYVPGGALARDLTDDVWSLDRRQVELVATRVSTANECFY